MSAPHGEGPGAPAPPPHLEIRALAVRYGAIRAVHDVSLEVRHDEIVTLVGSNGAGKSSTLDAIAGLVHPAAGEIRLAGARVDGKPPWELVARGVSHTPQGPAGLPALHRRGEPGRRRVRSPRPDRRGGQPRARVRPVSGAA